MKKRKIYKNFNREASHFCIEYWLKRGFSELEGKQKISEIQISLAKRHLGKKKTPEQCKKMSKITKKRYSLQYYIDRFGQADAQKEFDKFINAQREGSKLGLLIQRKTRDYRKTSHRCKEYWLEKGYSEKDAEKQISKIQYRGKNFYFKKYGKTLGKIKWKQRIKKWRKSFDKNDINAINEKRRLNAHVGIYNLDTSNKFNFLFFYAFTFNDAENICIKYGLTKKPSIGKRWPLDIIDKVLVFEKLKAKNAINLENILHTYFKNSYKPTTLKTTECCIYSKENIDLLLSEFNKIKANNEEI